MKMEITVAEAVELINQIHKQPGSLFEMILETVKENVFPRPLFPINGVCFYLTITDRSR